MFITIEGIEGVGKSTLIHGLKDYFESQGREVVLSREPGGTILSEKIRALLLDTNLHGAISPQAELFLFYASRFQNVTENILPALSRNAISINDRYFDSSRAYQVFGRKLDDEQVIALNNNFDLPIPDITFWLDAPVEVGMARASKRGELDRFEQEKFSFFERVRDGFKHIHKTEPDRFKRIDATQPQEQVLSDAIALIEVMNKA